jgi:hypothetical protein
MQERIIKGLATEDSQKKKNARGERGKGIRGQPHAGQYKREDSKRTKGKRGQLKNKMLERTVKGQNEEVTSQRTKCKRVQKGQR